MSTVAIALLGSGEFEPWTDDLEEALHQRLGSREENVLIVPTASAAEGDAVFDSWAQRGLDHYRRRGIGAAVLPLKSRADADDPAIAAGLSGASMVFLSGGNPAYLADTLRGTLFWAQLRAAVEGGGLALAGCSAGAMSLGARAFDSSITEVTDAAWQPGLALFSEIHFGPHWDALDRYLPGLRDAVIAAVPAKGRLLALDESTGVVGDGLDWSVEGRGAAHTLEAGVWRSHPAGERFRLALQGAAGS